jgi:hypothetical protein
MESIEQIREREFQEFQLKWKNLFTTEQTVKVASQIANVTDENVQALFRVSSSLKESDKKKRSWSLGFDAIYHYLDHRFSSDLERRKELYSDTDRKNYEPIIKIVNLNEVFNEDRSLLTRGVEPYEHEIYEQELDQDKVMVISRINQLDYLRNIILSAASEKDKVRIENKFEVAIRALEKVYSEKARIEAENLGYTDGPRQD